MDKSFESKMCPESKWGSDAIKIGLLLSIGNMRKLTWNEDLATVAQKWADQCLFDHDKNRNIPGYLHVGQNVYLQSISKKFPGIHIGKTVQKWFDEISVFNPNQIEPFGFTMGAGHFTQVAWAETHEVFKLFF